MKLLRQQHNLTFLLLVGIIAPIVTAQHTPQAASGTEHVNITIRSIRVIPGNDGCALEIISDHPLVPAIGKLENPARIVIDLPNARLSSASKRLTFRSSEVAAVRIGQFQGTVARIVVDLAQPLNYSWDAAGNRLMVRLHPAETSSPKATFVPILLPQSPPSVIPVSSSDVGTVFLAGNRLASGSSITAGFDTAVLNLGRGGEVRVCPETTVSVTSAQNGRSLMLGMSTGSLEAHYALDASSDSILTPDFRILLAGPGEFHYAISADPHGNTCVQALPGNTASVIVSEVLGDGTYQVKPAQLVVFRSGQLKTAASITDRTCGCPALTPDIMRASSPALSPDANSPPSIDLRGPAQDRASQPSQVEQVYSRGPEMDALPATKPNDIHVQVDVPFVFRADEPGSGPAQSIPTREAHLLPLRSVPPPAWLLTAVLPPVQAKAPHHGFFGRVKGFFSAIFG